MQCSVNIKQFSKGQFKEMSVHTHPKSNEWDPVTTLHFTAGEEHMTKPSLPQPGNGFKSRWGGWNVWDQIKNISPGLCPVLPYQTSESYCKILIIIQ